MTPMRRRTSSTVIAAAPPPPPPRPSGGWRCAATGTVSTARSRFRRYRITGGLEKGTEKLMRPSVADHGRARAAWPRSSRLAAFQLRLGPWLVLRGVALRLHPRLAPGGRSLPPWLGARWLGALLTLRRRGTSALRGLGRGVGLAASLAGTVPVTLVALIAGDGPRPRLHVGRCNDARAVRIATARADLAPLVVVHGTGADARDERVGGLAVLEDEARLGPERPREHDSRRTVGAIGVIVGIVVHDDPKTHAAVVVRAPGGIGHGPVAG